MSKRRPSARLVLAAVFLAASYPTPAPAAGAQTRETRVDAVFAPWSSEHSPGCAVSVMREGTIVFSKGYGRATLEHDLPITPSSVFQVASVAKQFTALAIQLLVNDGRVAWDDNIRDYLPELAGLDRKITLSQLAHHTSGIRDQWSLLRMAGWRPEADVVTSQDVVQLLARQQHLNFEPGSRYLYSNSGYTLLAIVVERETGQSLRSFTQERIFEPLGMTATHFHDDHQRVIPGRVSAYAGDGAGGYRTRVPHVEIVGATGLFTSVEDLAHWDRNFYTFDVGDRTGIGQLHEQGRLNDGRTTTYARGLAHGSHRGLPTVGHGGTHAGYRSEFVRFPRQRLSVAVLCNLRSTDPSALARQVADVYLPGSTDEARGNRVAHTGRSRSKATPEDRGTGPATNLAGYGGYYRRAVSDVPLHLVVRQGALVTIGTGPTLRFLSVAQDRFRVVGDVTTSAAFEGDDNEASPTRMRLGDRAPEVYERLEPWRPAALDDFEGVYESRELGADYTFTVQDQKLVFDDGKLGSIILVPTYRDGFYGDGLYLAFERDASGRVAGLTMSTPRAWKVRFTKVGVPPPA